MDYVTKTAELIDQTDYLTDALSGMRQSLILKGFSEETAEMIVVQIVRNQGK